MSKKETTTTKETAKETLSYIDISTGEVITPNEDQKVIHLIAETIKTDKNEFLAYKAVAKNGDLMTAKFTKKAKNVPEQNAYILVENENINVDRHSKRWPVLWIKDVNAIVEPDTKAQKEKKRKELDEMF